MEEDSFAGMGGKEEVGGERETSVAAVSMIPQRCVMRLSCFGTAHNPSRVADSHRSLEPVQVTNFLYPSVFPY